MDETANSDYLLLAFMLIVILVVASVVLVLSCVETPEEEVQREALEQRFAAVWAALPPPPVQVELPYFPYAGRGGRASECAICLEPLRHGQPCSEVPACRHAFHRDCLGMWAKSSGSCPLCRAKIIVLGSGGDVAVAEDMV